MLRVDEFLGSVKSVVTCCKVDVEGKINAGCLPVADSICLAATFHQGTLWAPIINRCC